MARIVAFLHLQYRTHCHCQLAVHHMTHHLNSCLFHYLSLYCCWLPLLFLVILFSLIYSAFLRIKDNRIIITNLKDWLKNFFVVGRPWRLVTNKTLLIGDKLLDWWLMYCMLLQNFSKSWHFSRGQHPLSPNSIWMAMQSPKLAGKEEKQSYHKIKYVKKAINNHLLVSFWFFIFCRERRRRNDITRFLAVRSAFRSDAAMVCVPIDLEASSSTWKNVDILSSKFSKARSIRILYWAFSLQRPTHNFEPWDICYDEIFLFCLDKM